MPLKKTQTESGQPPPSSPKPLMWRCQIRARQPCFLWRAPWTLGARGGVESIKMTLVPSQGVYLYLRPLPLPSPPRKVAPTCPTRVSHWRRRRPAAPGGGAPGLLRARVGFVRRQARRECGRAEGRRGADQWPLSGGSVRDAVTPYASRLSPRRDKRGINSPCTTYLLHQRRLVPTSH